VAGVVSVVLWAGGCTVGADDAPGELGGSTSGSGGPAASEGEAPTGEGSTSAATGPGLDGTDEGPDDPDSGSDGSEGSDSGDTPGECGGSTAEHFDLVGWATEAGGTTGGKGGASITVSTGVELQQALDDQQDSDAPLTIWVDGTITPGNSDGSKIDLKDLSDVSILGMGEGADFDGIGIKLTRVSNIVLRNLRVHHVDIGDKDAISIEGPADHIWVDHCELYAEFQGVDKDHYDGLLDAKGEAAYITYSWNSMHDSWKTALVGSSDGDDFDRRLTMHHNYLRNCNSRLPLFRSGTGHVFNNFYEDIVDTGINARMGACLRIERNYFSNARNPWLSAYSDELGAGELMCNVLADGSHFELEGDDTHQIETCTADVPYAYDGVLNDVEAVPDLVTQHAGVGKLADPSDF